MKLVRFGEKGKEKPGILDKSGQVRSLDGIVDDIAGNVLSDEGLDQLRHLDLSVLPVIDSPRLGPCVGQIGKILCIGLNYSDHAREANMEIPDEPVLFTKALSALNGPNDDIILPRGSKKTDWECELAIVIGKQAKYLKEEESYDHIAGYTILNDVSERAFQLERGGQWVKGKSCDTFAPLGPWLVTRDQVPHPQSLSMWLEVNGVRYQEGSTKTMIFGVAHIVSYLSQYMTLYPGDVISTGTPPGVGMGQTPPVYLKAGDRVSLGIQGLGVQEQNVITE